MLELRCNRIVFKAIFHVLCEMPGAEVMPTVGKVTRYFRYKAFASVTDDCEFAILVRVTLNGSKVGSYSFKKPVPPLLRF